MGSIPLAAVGAYKRLPSDMYLISCMFIWTIVNDVRLSCNKIKVEFIYLFNCIMHYRYLFLITQGLHSYAS